MLHLHNGEELHEWSDEEVRVDWQMPPLGMQQAVHTLRALGVRVVGCEQEADALIVVEARRVRAFAVLGRDSDFFVFTGARYVPIDFLSFDGEDCIRIVDASARSIAPSTPQQVEQGAKTRQVCKFYQVSLTQPPSTVISQTRSCPSHCSSSTRV